MKNIILISTIILFLLSCRKKEPSESINNPELHSQSTSSINYVSVKIGNYWIYDHYSEDTLGNITPIGIDSVYIYDTVFITGRKFFKGTPGLFGLNNIYVRDSSNYLVNEKGFVLCAYNNYADTFYRSSKLGNIDTLFYKMFSVPGTYTVPAGNFNNVIDARTTVFYNPSYSCRKIRYCNQFYADSVGMIYERYHFSSNCSDFIRKLVRYKIN
jgi:hypothetical protein